MVGLQSDRQVAGQTHRIAEPRHHRAFRRHRDEVLQAADLADRSCHLRSDPRRWQLRSARSAACRDRKSTRLNSSHQIISYAVFCLKKKKITTDMGAPTAMACRKAFFWRLTC